jgi:hypothetical protein
MGVLAAESPHVKVEWPFVFLDSLTTDWAKREEGLIQNPSRLNDSAK